jgi:transmembrane sensor
MRTIERPVGEQAAAWLATLSDESCTQEERRQFASWLVRANTHVEEFLRVSALARSLQGAGSWPEIDLDGLIAEARGQASVVDLRAREPWRMGREASGVSGYRIRRNGWLAAAAAVLVISIVAAFQWLGADRRGEVYDTRRGELRSVSLEDGSIVELNAGSRIRELYSPIERRIELVRGEAVFRVARNYERPFKVSTPFADIVAVGTQFNVDSRESHRTIVTVLEGKVRVQRQADGGDSPVLGAGDQVVIQREPVETRIARVDPARVMGWTSRRLYFEDTPLEEAAREFERYSERNIRIVDAALARRRITGTFDASDPGALVRFLERYVDTTVEESREGWRVGKTAPAAAQP